jgi:hypothetical protein
MDDKGLFHLTLVDYRTSSAESHWAPYFWTQRVNYKELPMVLNIRRTK